MNRRDVLAYASAAALTGSGARAQPMPVVSSTVPQGMGAGPLPSLGAPWGASLDLSFMTPGTLDPRISFTRAAGPATYFDSTGVLRTAGVNLLFPSVPDTTAWTSGAATVTLGASAAPDGTVTATRVAETTASALHYVVRSPVATTSLGPQTLSLYAKAAGTRYLQVSLDDSGSGTIGGYATFDLQAGVVSGALTARGAAVIGTAVIQAAANGFYRCSITVTTTGAALNDRAFLILSNVPAPAFSPTYAGNAANGLLVWGAQLEVGSAASPYIPTTSAASGAPRWDYDPVTHALRGLLIEEARTNIALQSGSLSGWAISGATLTAGAGIAPDGTNSFNRLAETAVTSFHAVYAVSTIVTATVYTASVFAKAAEDRYLQVVYDDGGADGVCATFDLLTGTISGPAAIEGTATLPNASMQAVGNGVYRCTVSAQLVGTTGRVILVTSNVGNPGFLPSYAGNAANGLLVWGAQLEAGAFPTSYIPSLAAAVTRAADSCVIPSANMGWFTPPGGSWMAEFIRLGGTHGPVIAYPSANSRMPLYVEPTNNSAGQFDGSAAMGTANAVTIGAVAKAATTWAANTASACLNAGAVASSGALTSGYADAAAAGLALLQQDPADTQSGYIRHVRYWPRALTNAELQSVTT